MAFTKTQIGIAVGTASVLVLVFVGFQGYFRTFAGGLWWDTTRLKIPLLGDALRKAD